MGFFKKVVIADRLAIVVDGVYNNLDDYSGLALIVATIFLLFKYIVISLATQILPLVLQELWGLN